MKRLYYRRWAYWLLVVLGPAGSSTAWAESDFLSGYQSRAQEWVLQTLAQSTSQQAALRYEVMVGELDSRLKLAPCSRVEYFVPVGSRLWGKTRVAMRCMAEGARWNVTIPVAVKAFGKAWVVKNPVSAGVEIRDSDVVEAEVDWYEESAAVLSDRSQCVGHLAVRPLNTGATLRQGTVKAAQAFQAGAPVRVLAGGVGFQVSAEAMALSVGVVGQIARVRMDNGRVASGLVLDFRTVRVDL
jgi:flagella basal body P-ring formation protein FlgA